MPDHRPPRKSVEQKEEATQLRSSVRALKEPLPGSPKVADLARRIEHLETVLRAHMKGLL